jgi:hypothetical protein
VTRLGHSPRSRVVRVKSTTFFVLAAVRSPRRRPTSSGGSHRVGLPPAPHHGEAQATVGDDNECPSSVRARRERLFCQMALGLVHFHAVKFHAAGGSIRVPCWRLASPDFARYPDRETRGGLERLGAANRAHRVLLDAVRLIPRARIRCSRSGYERPSCRAAVANSWLSAISGLGFASRK